MSTSPYCAPCRAAYQREYRNRRREYVRRLANESYYRHREKRLEQNRWYHIAKKYGVTRDQWQAMHDAQRGLCLLCDKEATEVDHCHATGRVRGLLCKSCNRQLGWVEKRLPTILDYLGVTERKSSQVLGADLALRDPASTTARVA